MQLREGAARLRGFTLIELMVTVAIVAILTLIALPNLATWMANSRVRTTAEVMQNGLRTAQAEAVKQARQTEFVLSNDLKQPSDIAGGALPTPTAGGKYWYVMSVPFVTADNNAFALIATGVTGDVAKNVTVTSAATAICFSSYGRISPASNNPSGTCSSFDTGSSPPSYTMQVSATGANRPLNVVVTSAGSVRMCDPAHNGTAADGC